MSVLHCFGSCYIGDCTITNHAVLGTTLHVRVNTIVGDNTACWGQHCMLGTTLYVGDNTLCWGQHFMLGTTLYVVDHTLCWRHKVADHGFYTLSGRIGKVVASLAAVARSKLSALIYTMHEAFRGYCP